MSYRQAKFCIDMNQRRWALLAGIITRKEPTDGPTDGRELSIEQVTAVEQVTVQRRRRSRLGWPTTLLALAILALAGWTATSYWPLAIPGFVVGLPLLYGGARRIPATTQVLEAYQIVAPGTNPEEWRVLGSIPEVRGFIEGVKAELKEKASSAPVVN